MNDMNQAPPIYVEAPTAAPDDEIDLRQLLGILIGGKWIIAGITAAVLLIGLAYAFLATPVYESNVLLQVNENNQAYQTGALSDLAQSLGGQAPPADTEIAIMTSRYVVGHTVDALNLDIDAKPHYFPLIGGFIARHYSGTGPASPWLWLSSYAWGGDQIKVTRLNVPDAWLDQPLTLVVGQNGHYTVDDPDGNKVLEGEVGKPAYSSPTCASSGSDSSVPTPDHLPLTTNQPQSGTTNPLPITYNPKDGCSATPSIFVSVLSARPGTRFNVIRHPRLEVIQNLQKNLSASETAKGTNIVRMSLDGPKPARLVAILDGLANTYVAQNVENNAEQARESLKFLQDQLPKLKADADASQVALAQYQAKHQALDISADTTSLLTQMVNIQQQLAELKLKETEMSQKFNSGFPGLQAVRAQIKEMQGIKAQLEDRINDVPKAEQQIFKLKRDVEVNNGLYTALLNQAQQLQVAQAGTVGNARIIDNAALPIKPVKPKTALIAALSLILGLMLGVFIVFGRKALARGVSSPTEVEDIVRQPVVAVVPYSRVQRRDERSSQRRQEALPILAQTHPNDLAVESLRSLRTSLHFTLMANQGKVVVITSPGPGAGKSFTSINLAALLGDAGRHVLIIDADLRRGHLHDYLEGADRNPGLSEILAGKTTLAAAVRPQPATENVAVLATGEIPSNPSELLMRPSFKEMLAEACRSYDLVVLDAPPVLAVTDTSVIAPHADALFMVIRDGESSAAEIRSSLKRIQQNGGKLTGVLYNALHRRHAGKGDAYYYYYSYGDERSS